MASARLGLVVARFDKQGGVVSEMEDSAREAAQERGAEIAATLVVPGSYDTPLAADRLARRASIDAVVVVGAIVTGDTDHDQVIGQAAADGLRDVALDRDTPVTLGITGPGMSADEAAARVGYGANAVESALSLAAELEDTAEDHT
ncbi:6,7-dimethyl-8-ribityllumazine synthase [Halobacteriales archaeon QH_10_67_13]|nr:MAG: 6,7-dimethyl-8-ribityllumazine synthase [Halobacteriales archaeon QH_10_67_13]